MKRGYRTVAHASEIEQIVHKSRFIGHCYPIECEEEALALLSDARKRFWDATHNCYAYSVGENGETARYSDDGEPSGTAGLPMMDAIRKNGVTNVICIVTRYFGGVLLGAGGLVRAYSHAAAAAVRASGIVEMRLCAQYAIDVPYPLWGRVEPVLRTFGSIDNTEFSDCVRVTNSVEAAHADAFLAALTERTDGKLLPACTGETLRAFHEKASSEE